MSNLLNISNYQLYELLQNDKLDSSIKKAALQEFNQRDISDDEIKEIISQHDKLYKPESEEPLSFNFKIGLILFPFFWVIHGVLASKYLSRGQNRKWKEYWLYFCLGLLLWTISIVIYAKYSLFKDITPYR